MKSDAQLAINSILSKIKASGQIINHITDIANLAYNFRSIQFSYCNRKANKLADAIVKRHIVLLL